MGEVTKESVLFQLNLEIQALGLQYLGDDPKELGKIAREAACAAIDRPRCYQRSFDADDAYCGQCDLWGPCSEGSVMARLDLAMPPPLTECSWCDGDLVIELFDEDGRVKDHACTTDGCRNTSNLQKARDDCG